MRNLPEAFVATSFASMLMFVLLAGVIPRAMAARMTTTLVIWALVNAVLLAISAIILMVRWKV